MYDRKIGDAVLCIGDKVLVQNVGIREKHRLANRWEKQVYEVPIQPNVDIPIYVVSPVDEEKHTRTLHRNLLLPISSLPLGIDNHDPDDVPEPFDNPSYGQGRVQDF